MPAPFGQTVFLWRRHRRLTQQQLAERAGLPRPNLCAIEQGHREVSLTTLRALALALQVPAGVLVEGVAPAVAAPPAQRLTRSAIERIANAVGTRRQPVDRTEQVLVGLLQAVLTPQRGRKQAAETAWLTLRAHYPRETLQTLLQRSQAKPRHHVA